MSRHEQLPAKKILVMRYRFIGDTILSVPFLRNLRYAYPQAEIDVLVGPQSGLVLQGCPYINDLIVFDTTRFHKYDKSEGKAKSFLDYAWQLRRKKYDLVFVLKRSLSSALLAWLCGAKYRVGYDTQSRGFLLSHKVKWDSSVHDVESMLDVLKEANVPIVDDHLEAWVSPQEDSQIDELVPELANVPVPVLVHAAAAHPDKMYPLQLWADVICKLAAAAAITPVFTGAQQDKQLYDELQQLCGLTCINLAGKLSLRQSLALYRRMKLAICVDSGPAHLAAAVNVPTVALFGPTDPVRWRPWGSKHQAVYDESLPCRPCNYHKTCDDRPCLTKLDPQIVVNHCLPVLKNSFAAGSTAGAD